MATGINNTSVKNEYSVSSFPNTQRTQKDLCKRSHHVIKLENINGDIDTSFTYWLGKFEQFCDLNDITENESERFYPSICHLVFKFIITNYLNTLSLMVNC